MPTNAARLRARKPPERNSNASTEANQIPQGLQGPHQRAGERRHAARQIEATRRAITREMKRQGKVWIRVFPDVPVTAKPIEVRMGKGKGAVDRWVARVAPGRILFEIDGVTEETARLALALGAAKLPIKTKVVKRIEGI